MKEPNSEFTFAATLEIQNNRIILTNVCTLGDLSATVSETAEATVTDSTITIHEEKKNDTHQNGIDCFVKIQKSDFSCRLDGNKTLIFSDPKEPDELQWKAYP